MSLNFLPALYLQNILRECINSTLSFLPRFFATSSVTRPLRFPVSKLCRHELEGKKNSSCAIGDLREEMMLPEEKEKNFRRKLRELNSKNERHRKNLCCSGLILMFFAQFFHSTTEYGIKLQHIWYVQVHV